MLSSKSRLKRSSRGTLLAGIALVGMTFACPALMSAAQSQTHEIVFASNLDPNNKSDPRSAAQTRIIEAFEHENPQIKIKVQVDPASSATLRAIKSKSATPDVFKMIGYGIPESVATGNVEPLDDYIKRDKIDEKDWLLPLRESAVKGRLYSLTVDYRIPILIYRKSLLQKAGVTPPRTWSEVCEAGGKLAKAGVMGYPVGIGAGAGLGGAQAFAEFQFSSMVTEGGGPYFDAEGKKVLITQEKFVRAANTIRDLFTKCGASPMSSLQFSYNEVHDGLRAGTIGMATFGVYRFGAIAQGGAGDDLGWAPPPSYEPGGKQTVYGYQVAMNAHSKQKDAAWKFISFIVGAQGQALAMEGGEVVARSSAYRDSPYMQTPAGQRQKEWANLVKQRGFSPTYPVNLTPYNQILGEAMQRMLLKNATPEDAYKELVTRYSEAIASEK